MRGVRESGCACGFAGLNISLLHTAASAYSFVEATSGSRHNLNAFKRA